MTTTPTQANASSSASLSAADYLALHNQHDVPKPFKRVQVYSTSSSGRKRNYKQIMAMEQEAQFEVGGSGISSKKKKSGGGKKAAGADASTSGKLVGAAAKAAKRKEDRLKREAAAAAAASAAASTNGSTRASSEATESAQPPDAETEADVSIAGAAADETVGDISMAAVDGEEVVEDEESKRLRAEQEEKREKERARKRSLPTFLSVEAPPSLRPAKKYCDVTGLLAPYTDPKTGLRYHSAEVYDIIKTFGPGVDQAYLALRGKVNTLV